MAVVVHNRQDLWEMGVDIVPRINKRSTFTVWGMLRFFRIGMVRIEIHGLLTYIMCDGRIGDDLFSLTTGRALAFHRRYNTGI